jgi:hypothetical protein
VRPRWPRRQGHDGVSPWCPGLKLSATGARGCYSADGPMSYLNPKKPFSWVWRRLFFGLVASRVYRNDMDPRSAIGHAGLTGRWPQLLLPGVRSAGAGCRSVASLQKTEVWGPGALPTSGSRPLYGAVPRRSRRYLRVLKILRFLLHVPRHDQSYAQAQEESGHWCSCEKSNRPGQAGSPGDGHGWCGQLV